LNGDGCLDEFYNLLWIKNNHGEEIYPFKLPHTIIFKDGKANSWMFSNSENKILKKSNKKIYLEHMKEVFK
jgi:hypothetical protein